MVQHIISGVIILNKGMPAAFMASSSSFSPKLPNVISDARSIARGSAWDTRVIEPSMKNLASTVKSRPLSTKSSIHLHNNCIMKINRQIKKVPTRFVAKVFIIKRSSFFILKWSRNLIYRGLTNISCKRFH